VLSGRALAVAVLAWALVKVGLSRLLRERSGLALFHENYDADRLPPLSPAEREALPRFSRCIACGRCDLGEAARIAASRGAYPGLMTIVLASSRSMPDFDAAQAALDHVPEAVLAEKEAICPTGVPFRDMARFIRAKATSGATLIVTVAALLVAGCAAHPAPPPETPAQAAAPSTEAPLPEASGKRGAARRERGRASYYSDRLAGRKTASGERYNPRELTAAHRTLPFGSLVDVIRNDGRQIRVRINDRGPFTRGRVIDLSRRAAEAIGLIRDGIAEVRLEVVSLP
jgi:hypothetical protein